MYVCLCKPLTEADVALAAQICLQGGRPSPEALVQSLNLNSEDCCGYCARNPEALLSIAEDEWEACSVDLADSTRTV